MIGLKQIKACLTLLGMFFIIINQLWILQIYENRRAIPKRAATASGLKAEVYISKL